MESIWGSDAIRDGNADPLLRKMPVETIGMVRRAYVEHCEKYKYNAQAGVSDLKEMMKIVVSSAVLLRGPLTRMQVLRLGNYEQHERFSDEQKAQQEWPVRHVEAKALFQQLYHQVERLSEMTDASVQAGKKAFDELAERAFEQSEVRPPNPLPAKR